MNRWATVIRETAEEGGRLVMIVDEPVDADDPRYEDEVHVVPCTVTYDEKLDQTETSFGVHDFTRQCYCHPTVEPNALGRDIVVHKKETN